MDKAKRKRLESAGYRFTTPAEFLEMPPEEVVMVELRIALAHAIKSLRTRKGLTQAQFAKQVASTQARVAKMEAGNPEVSLDLMLKALVRMGESRAGVARAIKAKVA